MITDPAYNPAYSNFCYETPFMPGQTAYLDTPVLPTMAFADGYNLPDCDYPDLTPAISSVTGDAIPGSSGRGPWVSASGAGHTLTINGAGDRQVLNHAYSGPRSTKDPFNKKVITRHYGFGSRPSNCPTSGNCLSATIAGVPLVNVMTWTNDQIVGTVPTLSTSQSTCTITQRTSPSSIGSSARCGELVITAANGKKSIDTVTVTIGGKPPTFITPSSPSDDTFGRLGASPVQTAIDHAAPGDLIILGAGTYRENVLMWKPVRLQGVGAYSVTINADAHPAGKMDAWRRQVNCVFGLTDEGRPAGAPYGDCPASMLGRVDRMPLEGIIGWDTTTNGNLAEQLQEPTIMGAYEGAGVTVLARGIRIPNGTTPQDRFGVGAEGGFPAGYSYLGTSTGTNGDCTIASNARGVAGFDFGTSNFLCNPSRIDGISIINSSQGGGAIFAHGWNHSLEISNTRVYGNHGTLTGGITIGSGEFPDPYVVGGDNPPPPNLPAAGLVNGEQAGYGFNRNVRVHNNSVTSNASIGDALYSGTNSAGGGVTFCTGADGYRFNNNWVCGNLSTGDGGGVVHSGFSNDGTIANNWIVFNQSQNSTIPTNGGGLGVLGAAPDRNINSGPNAGQECGSVNDLDCPPGLAEGTGRNLLIDANLIMGNSAESGTGGGLRLQLVNGQDVTALPLQPTRWNDIRVTNNIISNNVAGWDGGGVSLQDALRVTFLNNTVMENDTTATAGVLFNTLGAPLAAVPPPGCTPQEDPTQPQDPSCNNPVTTSTNQAAGLVTMRNTPNMDAAINDLPGGGIVLCPAGNSSGLGAMLPIPNGDCRRISFPVLRNNVFWHNRAFHIEVADLLGSDPDDETNQQKVVTLVPSLNQTATGFCASAGTANDAPGSGGPVNYWDIGVRGDTSATPNSGSGFTLEPRYSILTNASQYPGPALSPYHNIGSDPAVLRQYCNGARVPPENGGKGYNAPPGRSETTGLYPVFALNQITPAATVDEGNNWINLGYGPLSLVSPVDGQTVLGDYRPDTTSPAINNAFASGSPPADFFGTARPQGSGFDIGAVEVVIPPNLRVSPAALSFGTWARNTTSPAQPLTLTNSTGSSATGITVVVTAPFSRPSGSAGGNCGTTLAAGASCTINVVLAPVTATPVGAVTGSVTLTASVPVVGSPVALSGGVVASRATVSITPNPLTITLPSGSMTGTGIVTLTNTAPAGGAYMTVSGVSVSGGSALTYFYLVGALAGPDNCTGATLQPGASCTVTVRFTNVLAARGPTRSGTITFTDNAQPPTSGTGVQTGSLAGIATP
jgi:hypothetical protein